MVITSIPAHKYSFYSKITHTNYHTIFLAMALLRQYHLLTYCPRLLQQQIQNIVTSTAKRVKEHADICRSMYQYLLYLPSDTEDIVLRLDIDSRHQQFMVFPNLAVSNFLTVNLLGYLAPCLSHVFLACSSVRLARSVEVMNHTAQVCPSHSEFSYIGLHSHQEEYIWPGTGRTTSYPSEMGPHACNLFCAKTLVVIGGVTNCITVGVSGLDMFRCINDVSTCGQVSVVMWSM